MGRFWLVMSLAYLLGSLPFAVLATRIMRRPALHTLGDGNLGAKNVFLNVSPYAGILVGILDIGKGWAAIHLSQTIELDSFQTFIVGLAAIIGHNWSIWLRFDGGQGMATTLGVFLGLMPLVTLVAMFLIVIMLWLRRNWEFACGVGLAWVPLGAAVWEKDSALALYAVIVLPLIWLRKQIVTALRRRALMDKS